MTLNKSKGNMYPWPNLFTWNPLAGECSHECSYCYVNDLKRMEVLKDKYSGDPRIIEKSLKDKLGQNRTIFVESCGDLFADNVPDELILRILDHCREYPLNRYLLQSKNPQRMVEFAEHFPPRVIVGTTLETDEYPDPDYSKAPSLTERAKALAWFKDNSEAEIMVSIEPVIQFHLETFVAMLHHIRPNFVSIGADSGKNDLKEPSPEDIDKLIKRVEMFTTVRFKANLPRLVGNTYDDRIERQEVGIAVDEAKQKKPKRHTSRLKNSPMLEE